MEPLATADMKFSTSTKTSLAAYAASPTYINRWTTYEAQTVIKSSSIIIRTYSDYRGGLRVSPTLEKILIICPPAPLARGSCFAAVLFIFKNMSVTSVRPIISMSTRPTFTKYAGLVELWPWMNDLKYFRSLNGRCRGNQFCGQNLPPILTF